MKDERKDSKLRMLKIVFKTISKNYNPDRYGKIIEYLIENKIGLDEAIDTLRNDDFFTIEDFEESILDNSKPNNPDLLFQLKLRREKMLSKATESLQGIENRKRGIEEQIENKKGEIERKKGEIEKLKGTDRPTIKAINKSDYKLQLQINSPANFDKRLQKRQRQKEYLNNNRDFFDRLINNIIQESKGSMVDLDQLCLELEKAYGSYIGENGVRQLLEEKCHEIVEYRKNLKEQRIKELENEIRQIEKEIKGIEKRKKKEEEELNDMQEIVTEIKQDIDIIDSKLPEHLRGTKEERDKREKEKKKNQEEQEAYKSRREMSIYNGPGWQGGRY